MNLSFWQEGENPSEFYNRFDNHLQSAQQAYRDELKNEPYELLNENGERKLVVPGLQSVDLNETCNMSMFASLKNVKDEHGFKVAALKQWCENELTPLAWQRALVRTLPALREHGYDLDELQYPEAEMRINQTYFQLILNTLSKLYSSQDSAA